MNILGKDDVEAIAQAICGCSAAATVSLVKYAKAQKARYAENVDSVATLLRNKVIDEATARASLLAFTHSQEDILLALKGMKKAEAAIAINAALGAVAGIVNKAVGIPLLPA